ncbi:hypothetical protein HZA44_02530 [Candidatus Peregrinibacteria bacterium]|nr:hypothetical protein [Candidatus Peregrinibacteria bacterium]
MSKSDEPRQSFILAVVVGGLAIVISLLHISYTKGRSKFVFVYAAIALAILIAVAIGWPCSVSVLDAGTQSDSGISARVSENGSVFQAEGPAFPFYPDESVDAGVCEVPK